MIRQSSHSQRRKKNEKFSVMMTGNGNLGPTPLPATCKTLTIYFLLSMSLDITRTTKEDCFVKLVEASQ